MKRIKKQKNFFCEIPSQNRLEKSKIIRFRKNKWAGIKSFPYKHKKGKWSSIKRFPLASSNSMKFEVRYFEITPGGCSSLEYHNHVHVVICVKGKGRLRLGNRYKILKYLDIAYIAPNEIHQLSNPYKETFGFFCIVDAERDRPIELED